MKITITDYNCELFVVILEFRSKCKVLERSKHSPLESKNIDLNIQKMKKTKGKIDLGKK